MIHLTSQHNWCHDIRTNGLKPTPLTEHPELTVYTGLEAAIWLWCRPPDPGLDLTGCLLDRLMKLRSLHLLMLEVDVPNHWLIGPELRAGANRIQLHHSGDLNGWQYHAGRDFALCPRPISRRRIRVIKRWDFAQLLGLPQRRGRSTG